MISNNYKYFLTIAKEQSITKAAEKLYISQPALSKYVKRLENDLEIELFDHSRSPLRLTYAGERYLEYIEETIKQEAQLRKEFMEIKSHTCGKIVLGVSPWRAAVTIPDILSSFWTRYPNIKIILREDPYHSLCHMLDREEVDFCLMSFPFAHDNDFRCEVLMEEPILLALNRRSQVIAELGLQHASDTMIEHIDIACLREQTFILLRKDQNLRGYTWDFLAQNAPFPYNIFETSNIITALGLCNNGLGVTFVPFCGIGLRKQYADTVFFTVGKPIFSWSLGVVYSQNAYISRPAQLLIEHIKKYLKDMMRYDHATLTITKL